MELLLRLNLVSVEKPYCVLQKARNSLRALYYRQHAEATGKATVENMDPSILQRKHFFVLSKLLIGYAASFLPGQSLLTFSIHVTAIGGNFIIVALLLGSSGLP